MPPRPRPAPPPGFLPDAWFRAKKKALRAILATPASKPEDVAYIIQDRLIPFFNSFLREFNDIVTAPWARESVKDRVEIIVDRLTTTAREVQRLDDLVPVPEEGNKDTVDQLMWLASIDIKRAFEARVKKLSDAFKYTWSVNMSPLVEYVADLASKAPDDFVRALHDTTGQPWLLDVKYGWLDKMGFTKRAQKALLKKASSTFQKELLPKWVDRMYGILSANYTEHAMDKEVASREFDLYGMKVVIQDPLVTPAVAKQYLRFLDEAHAALKAKHLEQAWYGTIFIRDENAGGVNPNGADFGVGGHYEIAKNIIVIFERPCRHTVKLVIHELGHRAWFKQMTQEQRGRFESFVLAYTRTPPEHLAPIGRKVEEEALRRIDAAASYFNEALRHNLRPDGRFFRDILDTAKSTVFRAGHEFSGAITSALTSTPSDLYAHKDVYKLYENVLSDLQAVVQQAEGASDELLDSVHQEPEPKEAPPEGHDAFWNSVYEGALDSWLSDSRRLVSKAVHAARVCLRAAVEAHNKGDKALQEKWQEEQYSQEGDVPAVSEYGKSDIDEAFAEAFAFYVLEQNMTRPQLESFRAVLKSASVLLAEKLLKAARLLTLT